MPKQRSRQRIVFCDCFDCLDRPDAVSTSAEALSAAEAAARQLPPPKALLLFGSGFIRYHGGAVILDACSFPHLDRVAKEGCLGLLALQSVQGADTSNSALTSKGNNELRQMLGAHQGMTTSSEQLQTTLSERFKGMSALFASSSIEAEQIARSMGMRIEPHLKPVLGQTTRSPSNKFEDESQSSLNKFPPSDTFADSIVSSLGVHDGSSGADLLMIHIDVNDLVTEAECQFKADNGASEADAGTDNLYEVSLEGLEWFDSVIKALMRSAGGVKDNLLLTLILSAQELPVKSHQQGVSGSLASTREQQMQRAADAAGIHIPPSFILQPALGPPSASSNSTLSQEVMQPGGATLDPGAFIVTPRSAMIAMAASSGAAAAFGLDDVPCPTVSRPVQSWQKRGQEQVAISPETPLLVARRLPGVIRSDRCERLGLEECKTRGGQGCMLAERLMHEIAYKLGRADKYGA